ncbi:MAG: HAD hydrolase-like protein [Candidatus Doudnabacteria bacterium]|nr:HAD hydrolase-like protein [Candidatus Doudnabacteria bacterium]
MMKAVLFDADGMVINKPRRFSAVLSEEYGIPIEKVTEFFDAEFYPILIGKADLKEKIAKYLLLWGWRGTVDEFLLYWFRAEHYIDERVVGDIQRLKQAGIKCYMVTDNEKYRTEYMENQMNFAGLFEKVFSSSRLGADKPNVEFWKKVLDDVREPVESILIWDDEEKNLASARQLGLRAELYTGYENFKARMVEYDLL